MLGVAFAMAQGGEAGAAGGLEGIKAFVPLILMFVIFYFLLIRPQQKRQKEHKELLANLKRGDDVVTSGGIMGRITAVADTFVTIEVAEKVRIKVARGQIMSVIKGESEKAA
ncbi:MAG: preprotein translocase subunit YajC [Deltaproteobacteria bacterium]|nr:preprotein translocase subunit YajC [Deltaproteobacteria bacterium]